MNDGDEPANNVRFPNVVEQGDTVLTLDPGGVYVEFTESLSPPAVASFLGQFGLHNGEGPFGVTHLGGDEPVARARFRCAVGEDTARLLGQLRDDARVATASPLYHRADRMPADTAASFSDRLLVHFHPGGTAEEIHSLIASSETDQMTVEPLAHAGVVYRLQLQSPRHQDIFAVVDQFSRSPLVASAGPDWIQLQSPNSGPHPNDDQFPTQWNLHQISAPAGWAYTLGSSGVVIAVIDSGCDPTHPELAAKYVAPPERLDVLADGTTPILTSSHGTMCAGVAAAQTNNVIGLAGVAPNCRIMPIRLYDDTIRSQLDIVSAVNWARVHGAAVINMSWHYDGPPHDLVDIALDDAYDADIVLVAASGNCFKDRVEKEHEACGDPTFIQYPASHHAVMAVGASDRSDHRQNRYTSNFSPLWDSIYGPKLSVVAPGISCPTTIIGGYDQFYGTSAAAPHVAGLAALLLSLPESAQQPAGVKVNDWVRSIIERTAAKVGGYSYAHDGTHLSGTWNAEMGYGRIDVVRALKFATGDESLESASHDYALAVQVLYGLISGGEGVILAPGGHPVPIDPGWMRMMPEQRDVLLGLAATELAKAISEPEASRAMSRAGWDAIGRAAARMGNGS